MKLVTDGPRAAPSSLQPDALIRRGAAKPKRRLTGLWFVLPAMVWLVVFHIAPMAFGLAISLFQYRLTSEPSFVGIDNYIALASNETFLRSLAITAVYVLGTVVAVWAFSFVIAVALSRHVKFDGLWKVLLFLPTIVPTITIALLWIPIFDVAGPFNALLGLVGIEPVEWLTSPSAAPWAMIILSWWQAASYYTVMFLSGLQAIPDEPSEAATVDGANALQRFRYITLPAMRPTIGLVVVISVLNALQTFIFQNIVTGGGPAGATEIITLLIYRTGFEFLDMGTAAAMSVVLFLLTFIVASFQMLLLSPKES